MTTTHDDIAEVRAAFYLGGRGGALADIHRRWPLLNDEEASAVLARVLGMHVNEPWTKPNEPKR